VHKIPEGQEDGFFDNTHWSTIFKAQAGGEQTRFVALDRLLTRYRRPIILHIQHRQRCEAKEAEELAHQFIEHWMRHNLLRNVSPDKGRFRTYVKGCIRNFLIDLRRRAASEKRKPGEGLESIDETKDGRPVHQPPASGLSPDEEVDCAWARQVLAEALAQLERECTAARRRSLFAALKPALGSDAALEAYASIGARLGMSETAVKTAAHRLRQRLGELIQEEVKQTVGTREDWQEELRYLIELMGKS
jgi:RNA polymerase sigma factor (sigma-70 family)